MCVRGPQLVLRAGITVGGLLACVWCLKPVHSPVPRSLLYRNQERELAARADCGNSPLCSGKSSPFDVVI
jgi:hypothetical protein